MPHENVDFHRELVLASTWLSSQWTLATVLGGGAGNLVPRVSLSCPPFSRSGGAGERDPGNEVGGREVGSGKLCVPSEKSRLRPCSVSKRMSEHDGSEHQQTKGRS